MRKRSKMEGRQGPQGEREAWKLRPPRGGALLSLHTGKGVESSGQGRKPAGEGRKQKQPPSPGFHQAGWSLPQEGWGERRWLRPEEKEKG